MINSLSENHLKFFVSLALLFLCFTQAAQSAPADRCSPRGVNICESGSIWVEKLTKHAAEIKKENPNSEVSISRAEANGSLVTIYFSIRYTRMELDRIHSKTGETIDTYMGWLDSAAHKASCVGPALSIIANGGVIRNVYTLADGEPLTYVTVSNCTACVED